MWIIAIAMRLSNVWFNRMKSKILNIRHIDEMAACFGCQSGQEQCAMLRGGCFTTKEAVWMLQNVNKKKRPSSNSCRNLKQKSIKRNERMKLLQKRKQTTFK